MSSLNITSSTREIFKCPNCNQYISSDICPKCSFQITNETKQRLVLAHDEEVKRENRKFYMNFVYGGLGSMGLGLLWIIMRVINDDEISSKSIGLTIIGLGTLIWGLRGVLKER